MRIALLSPYSWTYPGGVTRHIEALADQFDAQGHYVRIFAPYDPDDRCAAIFHRGARPRVRDNDPRLISLGRTVGFPANGAISNLAITPHAVWTMRRELRLGNFDVVHIHEPIAPLLSWDALCSTKAPIVGTFHCYSDNVVSNGIATLLGARRRLNRLRVRIAVSQAAAWTGQRFFGGHYRVIENGVDLLDRGGAELGARSCVDGEPLRIVFVGQAVERKGLPVLLRAFEALREQVPAVLTIVGADHGEISPMLLDDRGVRALGKVSEADKQRCLRDADVLCAPSLGGESFGMVLTEAFAAGTPVIASDIPGYAGVVTDRLQGRLVPRGDAVALAQTLREMADDSDGRLRMGKAAAQSAARYAWPRIAGEVLGAYQDAVAVPAAQRRWHRKAVSLGLMSADLMPRQPARRIPSLQPVADRSRSRLATARRIAFGVASIVGVVLALLALRRIGFDRIAGSLLASSPGLVLVGLALMCASMAIRAIAWRAILCAALPGRKVRLADALQGTFIGVLMSATLPARLGEPSRALIVARRLGRVRESLPVVLGTIVSQTLLNIVALLILGVVMFSSINFFDGHHSVLLAASLAPILVAISVLLAPTLISSRSMSSRYSRLQILLSRVQTELVRMREGMRVFCQPRLGAIAIIAQLGAWAIQLLACYVLLAALGIDGSTGIGAAAAVLFAVNVTAVLPVTPANLGIFQAACVAVLTGAYHVSYAHALGYGIILQAVEIATAIVMGMPALVNEGMSWRDVRMRALHTSPIELSMTRQPSSSRGAAEA